MLGNLSFPGRGGWDGAQNRLYLNDGTGPFTDATTTNMPAGGCATVPACDVDLDGNLDLLFSSGRHYLNDGHGMFADATATRMPAVSGNALACCDLDADGDPDIVRGMTGQSSLYLSLLRHLDAPVDLGIGQPYTLDASLRHVQASAITFALPLVSFRFASIPLPPTLIAQPVGVGSLNLSIVDDPGLIGTRIDSQALLVPYPWQATLSNVVR